MNTKTLLTRISEAPLPAAVADSLRQELDSEGDDANVVERISRAVELPWEAGDPGAPELADVRRHLHEDLFVPEAACDRILEHLAVRESEHGREDPSTGPGRMLCLAGPQGVGTTTIARGVGKALRRPVETINLPHLTSPSEFFGSEGAPGALMTAIERAGTADAVIILEGLDRFGSRWPSDQHGVTYALAERTRRGSFRDPFFGVPFDLSRTLVIATARWTYELPADVLARLMIVGLEGYALGDKLTIAGRSMVPSVLADYGIAADSLEFDEDALRGLITTYTSEPGLAQAEALVRRIARRELADRLLQADTSIERFTSDLLVDYLGRPRTRTDRVRDAEVPGVAGALVIGRGGGRFEYAEAANMPGSGRVRVTGSDGTDLTAKTTIIPSMVRSHLSAFGISARFLEEFDTHVVIPVGELPGDEQAAALAAAIAMVSLMRDRAVDPEVAATGAVTLHGGVMPARGIAHKMLAAHRAGVRRALLPRGNEGDLDGLPAVLREDMTFIPVATVAQALQIALR